MLSRGGNRQASFVDIIGFKELPEFLPRRGMEKAAVKAITERTNEQMKEVRRRSMPERKEAAVRL